MRDQHDPAAPHRKRFQCTRQRIETAGEEQDLLGFLPVCSQPGEQRALRESWFRKAYVLEVHIVAGQERDGIAERRLHVGPHPELRIANPDHKAEFAPPTRTEVGTSCRSSANRGIRREDGPGNVEQVENAWRVNRRELLGQGIGLDPERGIWAVDADGEIAGLHLCRGAYDDAPLRHERPASAGVPR